MYDVDSWTVDDAVHNHEKMPILPTVITGIINSTGARTGRSITPVSGLSDPTWWCQTAKVVGFLAIDAIVSSGIRESAVVSISSN